MGTDFAMGGERSSKPESAVVLLLRAVADVRQLLDRLEYADPSSGRDGPMPAGAASGSQTPAKTSGPTADGLPSAESAASGPDADEPRRVVDTHDEATRMYAQATELYAQAALECERVVAQLHDLSEQLNAQAHHDAAQLRAEAQQLAERLRSEAELASAQIEAEFTAAAEKLWDVARQVATVRDARLASPEAAERRNGRNGMRWRSRETFKPGGRVAGALGDGSHSANGDVPI
jgi:F0F1-type ATP synthase membrane subunit b/b'